MTESDGQSTPIYIGSFDGFSKAYVEALPFVPGRKEVPLLYVSSAVRREAFGLWLSQQNFRFPSQDDVGKFDDLLGTLKCLLRGHDNVWIMDSMGKDTGERGLKIRGSILW